MNVRRTQKKAFGFMAVVESFKSLCDAGVEPADFDSIRRSKACACRVVLAIQEAATVSDGYSDLGATDSFYDLKEPALFASWVHRLAQQLGHCYLVVLRAEDDFRIELLWEKPTFTKHKYPADQESVAMLSLDSTHDWQWWQSIISEDHSELKLVTEEQMPNQNKLVEVLLVEVQKVV